MHFREVYLDIASLSVRQLRNCTNGTTNIKADVGNAATSALLLRLVTAAHALRHHVARPEQPSPR